MVRLTDDAQAHLVVIIRPAPTLGRRLAFALALCALLRRRLGLGRDRIAVWLAGLRLFADR